MSLHFDHVSFVHEGGASPIFDGVVLHCGPGWTGIVGANGSGKTTLLRLALGELAPDAGHIRRPARVAHCPQRTDAPSPDLWAWLDATDAEACRLRGVFGVGADWHARWQVLSHGERKRAQIGAAMWRAPDLLLLDEPTNHLDAGARAHVLAGLRLFRGVGVLVSHDRDLLDALCRQCAFLDPPGLLAFAGGYSQAMEAHRAMTTARRRARDEAADELARVRAEGARRAQEAARADRLRSKRGLAKGDSDGRARIDRARVTGADGRAGALSRQMAGRVVQAEQRLRALALPPAYELGLRLPGARSARARLLAVPAGDLPLGGRQVLRYPALSLGPDDRVAITGPNGAGKSTLVRHLLAALRNGPEKVVYLPQEVSAEESRALLRAFRALPPAQQGRVLTIVSALGSRPPRLLESQQASPGEVRKLLLALGAVGEPHLIVMDEPTNHLDLPAIECLEEALAGCGAALLLVSHDQRFLDRLATVRWRLEPTPSGSRLVVV